MCSIEEVSDAHAASGLWLYFNYPERSLIAALHHKLVTVSGNHFSRQRVRRGSLSDTGFPYD